MERNVVLTHELVKTDITVLPPFFVIVTEQVSCDWNVTDWGIKPDVKNFFLKLLKRNCNTPFQISGDAFGFQSHVGPGFGCWNWVLRPFTLGARLINPLFKVFLNFWQINEEMDSVFKDRSLFADKAMIILHLSWIVEKLLALIALIAPCVFIPTEGTCTTNKSISQEKVAIFTIALGHLLFLDSVFFLDVQENVLTYLGMPFGWSPAKIVEVDIEPFVNFCVDFMIMVANLSWGLLFFQSLNLCGCTVLISTANIQDVWSLKSLKTGVNISGKYASNDITQMRNVIDVGKGWSYKGVLLAFLWGLLVDNDGDFLGLEFLKLLFGDLFLLFGLSFALWFVLLFLSLFGGLLLLLLKSLLLFFLFGVESFLEFSELLFGESCSFAFWESFKIFLSFFVFLLSVLDFDFLFGFGLSSFWFFIGFHCEML